jgi:hypothetical protein
MPDRYTTEEAGAALNVTPARVRQLAKDLGIEPERLAKGLFFCPAQIKLMKKWLKENGYRKKGAE